MKLILTSITILILGLGISGQSQSKDAKKWAKEQAKAEKQRLEQDKKARLAEAERATVNIKMLSTFPQDYRGKNVRLHAVTLDEVAPYSSADWSGYFLAVSTEGDSLYAYPDLKGFSLVLPTPMARTTVEEIGSVPGGYKKIVDIWMTVEGAEVNGVTYYLGNVKCIAFLTYRGEITHTIGVCPN